MAKAALEGGRGVPMIVTPRLRLRAWRVADLAPMAVMHSDAEMMRFIGEGKQMGAEAVAEMVAGFEDEWTKWGHGRWAVEERGRGEVIGSMGFVRFQEGTAEDAPELAYGLARTHWGLGLATEGGAAALEWASAQLGARRVVAVTHPENAGSQRVLGKLGFEPDGVFAGRHYEMAKFAWMLKAGGARRGG